MMSPALTGEITVRFAFTDAWLPDASEFSEEELRDIRGVLEFSLCWNPCRGDADGRILEVEILYDGIAPVAREDFGYSLGEEGEGWEGYPAPVVRFKLDRPVDQDYFLGHIFESSFYALPSVMEARGEDPWIVEDQSGYTSILSEEELDHWIRLFNAEGVFCGKVFRFPEGLPEGGHIIPAMEFALPLCDVPSMGLESDRAAKQTIKAKEDPKSCASSRNPRSSPSANARSGCGWRSIDRT